ncbi:retrovirus-related pol polyprotein from transposon TNT 1-94 [Tanacetum coccineum]
MNIVLNSSVIICDSEKKNEDSVDTCNQCLELEADLVKKNDVSQLQAKDTVISKLKEIIHSMRENANPANLKKDIDEIETINIELEYSVANLLSKNEKLHKEKEHLKKTYKELYDLIKLIKNELRKLKGKNVIDTAVLKPYATTIALGMFKLNLEPLAPKEIVESARVLSLLDSNLDLACKYVQRIQEVLVYIRDTCPCLTRTSKKLVAVTPKIKDKKLDLLTLVIGSTGASRSKPTGNTKNNRISQSSSSNKTNKLEDQSRSIKSRNNKKNHVAKTKCNVYVMQSLLNANSKSLCTICNECLFDANHDKCFLDYIHDVNVLSKSTPSKLGNKCPLTRFTSTKVVPLKETTTKSVVTPTQGIMVYSRRPKASKSVGCPNCSVINILECRNVTISRVYYIEGLRHNLFSVGQFCDSDLEVAFRLLKLKFENDNLCSACSLGKSKKQSHKTKSKDNNQEKLYLLHMDLYGPMRVESINGKKYILVIVDDYSWFTWVKFLRSKDEAPDYDEDVAISHETSVARTPQQNSVVERRNQTLLEAAGTMLIYANAPLFLWAKAVATACYTPRTVPCEDLGKLKAKANVDFDELIAMASEQSSSGPVLHDMTPGTLSSRLVPQPPSSTPFAPPTRND